ncbi:MAG: hypothetical protein ACI9UN_000039 [Granulosicoccus sp.]|jgi:hypothetical protein
MYTALKILPAFAVTIALSNPVWAGDARSIALGGSAIANGQGAHGALENPASMMTMKRAGQRIHFRIGFSADIRDTGDLVDTLTDDANTDLISDIEAQVEELSTRVIQCDPIFGNAEDVCVDNTQAVSDLATQLLTVVNSIDDESVDAQVSADLGMAFTMVGYPVAVNLRIIATGNGTPDIVETDKDYILELANLLDDDSLTLDEIRNSTYIEADEFGIPLSVQLPEDVLQSEGYGSSLVRTQLGIGFAKTLTMGGFIIDTGITPKFSKLDAYSLNASLVDELDDTTGPIQDRFEDSEVSESTFTFDVGASMALSSFPVRVAAVIRNVIPESIQTLNGFEFETTPQIIVGVAFKTNLLSITGDLALNKAKQDNFESRKFSLGVELGFKKLAFRGGISHDAAREDETTAFTLGFGLGPLQVGARLSELTAIEGSLQMSYSF